MKNYVSKVLIFVFCFYSFVKPCFSQKIATTFAVDASVHIRFGTQLTALRFGLGVFGRATYHKISTESGINLNLNPFLHKFGIYTTSYSHSVEIFSLVGYGKNDNLLGSNIGIQRQMGFYDFSKSDNFFYGLGLSVVNTNIHGELAKFSNSQGGFLMRLSNHQNSFTINASNDANGKPFSKTGTDKGYTARIRVNFTTQIAGNLYLFGTGMDMFTPEADYSRTPRNLSNSESGSRIVSYNTKPFDNLFHLNLFGTLGVQSKYFNTNIRVGVDSPKTGAYLQNTLHDSFGLYPRFSWPVTLKMKPYTLVDTSKNIF